MYQCPVKLFKGLCTFDHEDPVNLPDSLGYYCHGYSLWSTNKSIHITGMEPNGKIVNLTLFCIYFTNYNTFSFEIVLICDDVLFIIQ